ncbi:nucleotidyltransferase domain-containing protein [Rossellomorea sp. YZS02]|uniref:nucleotidyltransferase domain-containing protein n=1 Tax=Rossellomorea sp. YZS02 TaxID=3097358 RepID=UPI002A14FCF7|nr:nucleotidyltransferase domain-containing protein [Rossellomorea sp. YZS02]MDX8342217.1 nucleotidyltransferase domain-containing protein [Rossellomorea sp. YZS02]
MGETIVNNVKRYLMDKYHCHTVILYGSYSRGDFTEESDIDIICFSDTVDDDRNDVEIFEGKPLDVWIYDTDRMKNPEQFLHVHKGKILIDNKNLAEEFLLSIERILNEGPRKLSDTEKDFLKSWLRKMYLRSCKNDIEGNYRFHWALKDSLEIYFELRGLWYLGPKRSFNWLKDHDERAYDLFEKALAKNADPKCTKELFHYLINGDEPDIN